MTQSGDIVKGRFRLGRRVRPLVRCWWCKHYLRNRHWAWDNVEHNTRCWKCRCGFLTVTRWPASSTSGSES